MRVLQQNKQIQKQNNVPEDFPNFIREGFEVKVIISDDYIKRDSGLIYRDFEVGKGDCPKDAQQVTFHYVGYNESGRRIDNTYIQGSPAKIRMGNKSLVPGFEEGIRDMRPGGKRRIVIPPDLGPPGTEGIYNSVLVPAVDGKGQLWLSAVCLCGFEANQEISELSCKHFFHRGCLDKWSSHELIMVSVSVYMSGLGGACSFPRIRWRIMVH